METEAREVCEKLDDTLLKLMKSLKEISALRNRYRDVVREGYLTMSQARHAMGGPSRVSQLQYDSTMKALVKLELNSNLGSCDQPENNSHTEFRVHRTKPGDVKSAREEKVVARRRKGESSGIEDVTLVEKDGEGVVEGEETKDPIKWFGILVPQSLRRSQQCFIEAVNIVAELAAAQVRFQTAHRQYEELTSKKRELTVEN